MPVFVKDMAAGIASYEALALRLQVIENACKHDPAAPDYENMKKWMGTPETEDGTRVSPEKRRQVATELKEEADILKERRKAREEAKLRKV